VMYLYFLINFEEDWCENKILRIWVWSSGAGTDFAQFTDQSLKTTEYIKQFRIFIQSQM
jgi:hypothetical protein